MGFKPSLSKRQRILSKRLGVERRSKKFESLTLSNIEEGGIGVNLCNMIVYKDNKVYSAVTVENLIAPDTIEVYMGERTLTFNSVEKFELWLVRRILRATGVGKTELKDRLMGIYSLLLSTGLVKW